MHLPTGGKPNSIKMGPRRIIYTCIIIFIIKNQLGYRETKTVKNQKFLSSALSKLLYDFKGKITDHVYNKPIVLR